MTDTETDSCKVLLFSEDKYIEIHPASIHGDTVIISLRPRLSWIIIDGTQQTLDGSPAYICSAKIPHTLDLSLGFVI